MLQTSVIVMNYPELFFEFGLFFFALARKFAIEIVLFLAVLHLQLDLHLFVLKFNKITMLKRENQRIKGRLNRLYSGQMGKGGAFRFGFISFVGLLRE